MRAADILPALCARLLSQTTSKPAKFRQLCRSTARRIEENAVVIAFLTHHGLGHLAANLLYPRREEHPDHGHA